MCCIGETYHYYTHLGQKVNKKNGPTEKKSEGA